MCTAEAPTLTARSRRGRISAFKVTVWTGCHLSLIFLPMTYGRAAAIAFLVSTYITLQFGLVLGYHRLVSHRAFQTHPWLQGALALIGTLAGQAGPIRWAAIHRHHHRFSDLPDDPHSPQHGFAWAHFLWALHVEPTVSLGERERLTRDLARHRFLVFCDDHFRHINLAAAVGTFLIGWVLASAVQGAALVVWAVSLRMVCLWHITFLVNSLGHVAGYRNFETADRSRNSWLLGILAMGDGWHNNHHASPASAAHGIRWFEVDVTYRLIRVLERLGLAWNVRHPKARTLGLARASKATLLT